ncbi:hypothetical protein NLI96_g2304 [Meripilus lineatus]|uniref:F-box domain-containing protein n=1 Tax=Meripilus lineatus TaxID=2056292 RepID=A0AAD5V8S8_9APHY|nr:hypothetical protein NLI96_g2304 [Physisporinus lineatus]
MVISCHKKSVPIEVLELIFSDVPQASLPSLLLANSLFYAIAVRVLYRCLPEIPPTRTINMLKALVNNPPRFNTKKPSTYVRLLHLDFSAHRITGNFLRLLRKAFSLTQISEICPLNSPFTITISLWHGVSKTAPFSFGSSPRPSGVMPNSQNSSNVNRVCRSCVCVDSKPPLHSSYHPDPFPTSRLSVQFMPERLCLRPSSAEDP